MTIALIGNENSVRATARIGLVSPQGSDELTTAVEQAGHEAVSYTSWNALVEGSVEQPVDVIFCDEAMAADVPAGVTVPDFSELTESLARRLARDLGLELEAAYQSVGDSGQAVGQAVRQLPAKGSEVAAGERVLVVFTQP